MNNKQYTSIDSVLKYYPPVTFKNLQDKIVTEAMNRYHIMYEDKMLSKVQLDDIVSV